MGLGWWLLLVSWEEAVKGTAGEERWLQAGLNRPPSVFLGVRCVRTHRTALRGVFLRSCVVRHDSLW